MEPSLEERDGVIRKKSLSNEINMKIISYTKQELALLYFPDATPEVASAHLRRWIILCEPLYEQLLKTGYSKSGEELHPPPRYRIFSLIWGNHKEKETQETERIRENPLETMRNR